MLTSGRRLEAHSCCIIPLWTIIYGSFCAWIYNNIYIYICVPSGAYIYLRSERVLCYYYEANEIAYVWYQTHGGP